LDLSAAEIVNSLFLASCIGLFWHPGVSKHVVYSDTRCDSRYPNYSQVVVLSFEDADHGSIERIVVGHFAFYLFVIQ